MILPKAYPIKDWASKPFRKSVATNMKITPTPTEVQVNVAPTSVTQDQYNIVLSFLSNAIYNCFSNYNHDIYTLPNMADENGRFSKVVLVGTEKKLRGISNWKTKFLSQLGIVPSKEVSLNASATTSMFFTYKNVAIEFHVIPEDLGISINVARQIWANSGVFSLVQVIAKSLGLKLSNICALSLPIMYKGEEKTSLHLTSDINTITSSIMQISNYLYTGYARTQREAFNYIAACPYFCKELFLQNLDAATPTPVDPNLELLPKFVKYLQETTIIGASKDSSVFKTKPWLREINRVFPHVMSLSTSMISDFAKDELVNKKLNFDIIKKVSGCNDTTSVKILEHIKKSFSDLESFEIFAMSSLPETIAETIKKAYEVCNVPELVIVKKGTSDYRMAMGAEDSSQTVDEKKEKENEIGLAELLVKSRKPRVMRELPLPESTMPINNPPPIATWPVSSTSVVPGPTEPGGWAVHEATSISQINPDMFISAEQQEQAREYNRQQLINAGRDPNISIVSMLTGGSAIDEGTTIANARIAGTFVNF